MLSNLQKKSLRKIKNGIEKGIVGAFLKNNRGCAYELNGKYCAVGVLFNKKQLADLEKRKLNESGIQYVCNNIGRENLIVVTGFDVEELELLQYLHDDESQDGKITTDSKLYKTVVECLKANSVKPLTE